MWGRRDAFEVGRTRTAAAPRAVDPASASDREWTGRVISELAESECGAGVDVGVPLRILVAGRLRMVNPVITGRLAKKYTARVRGTARELHATVDVEFLERVDGAGEETGQGGGGERGVRSVGVAVSLDHLRQHLV